MVEKKPISSAGKELGFNDDRHLWPVLFGLIAECRPITLFGEQVAAAVTNGWQDQVADNLEEARATYYSTRYRDESQAWHRPPVKTVSQGNRTRLGGVLSHCRRRSHKRKGKGQLSTDPSLRWRTH